jgi:hypothetical protein
MRMRMHSKSGIVNGLFPDRNRLVVIKVYTNHDTLQKSKSIDGCLKYFFRNCFVQAVGRLQYNIIGYCMNISEYCGTIVLHELTGVINILRDGHYSSTFVKQSLYCIAKIDWSTTSTYL